MIQNMFKLKGYIVFIFALISTPVIIGDQPVITAQEELDLELFETHSQGGKPFFDLLDNTQTMIGKKALKTMLRNPLHSKQSLEQRQQIIKELAQESIAQTIAQELHTFRLHEPALYSLLDNQDPIQKAALEEFYFSMPSLKQYNTSPTLLTGLQALGVAAMFGPLLEHALLHFFISNAVKEKYHIGCNHDHAHDHDAVSAGPASLLIYNAYNIGHWSFHFLGAKAIYDHIKQKALVIKSMQASLMSASQCIQSMEQVYKTVQKDSLVSQHIPHHDAASLLFETPEKLPAGDTSAQLIELLKSNTFQGAPSVWSNIGNVLTAYRLMETAHVLRATFEYIGQIDAHASIAHLYTAHKDDHHPYTFALYQIEDTPQVIMEHVWNPHLGIKCCTHSMALGNTMPNTSIITGDNAAGKSTMIKSMALALLLGQTLTIVPADKLSFTPFAKICSSIKHADNIQAGTSLFITETLKAQQLLDTLGIMAASEFTFAIFDELFRSTSFEKGQKTAYEFVSTLGKCPKILALVATHYAHLTTLEDEQPHLFRNYLSQVRTNSQGAPIFELTAKNQ